MESRAICSGNRSAFERLGTSVATDVPCHVVRERRGLHGKEQSPILSLFGVKNKIMEAKKSAVKRI